MRKTISPRSEEPLAVTKCSRSGSLHNDHMAASILCPKHFILAATASASATAPHPQRLTLGLSASGSAGSSSCVLCGPSRLSRPYAIGYSYTMSCEVILIIIVGPNPYMIECLLELSAYCYSIVVEKPYSKLSLVVY